MSIRNGLLAITLFLASTAMIGCGSVSNTGSSGDMSASGNSEGLIAGNTTAGKVGILIKDTLLAHPNPDSDAYSEVNVKPELSQLWVTINRVSLKMEEENSDMGVGEMEYSQDHDDVDDCAMDEDEWLTVFEGTVRYDLLTLQDNNTALMSLVPVTLERAGLYEKARLEIDTQPGMNCFYTLPDGLADDPMDPCKDSNSDAYLLDVPSGKVDVKFEPHIYLGPDTTEYIVFDMLPAESIHITESNGQKGYLLRPVVHAYTVSDIMQDNGWSDIRVEKIEGYLSEIIGCDDPDLLDTVVLSTKDGSANVSIDISGADIYMDDSDTLVACSSLRIGQELEVKVRISSEGNMTAERIEIEEESHHSL